MEGEIELEGEDNAVLEDDKRSRTVLKGAAKNLGEWDEIELDVAKSDNAERAKAELASKEYEMMPEYTGGKSAGAETSITEAEDINL